MTDAPSYQELASRYIDLWQEELRSVVDNPVWAAQLLRFLEISSGIGPGGSSGDKPVPGAGGPVGATTAPPAPAHRDDVVDELQRRVSALEKRLRALESGITDLKAVSKVIDMTYSDE